MRNFESHVSTVYEYPCSSSTDCYPFNVSLENGLYSFEVWGASGGGPNDELSAPGGYSYGEIHVPSKTTIFIFLGGKGVTSTIDGLTESAFNGGGKGSKDPRHQYDSSGGGASDIRVNEPDLFHRVIVAGGGGGSGHDFFDSQGGYGGGENGIQGSEGCYTKTYCVSGGKGGEQKGDDERFGLGEDHQGGDANAAGGGGGWFGGFAGEYYGAGGGGGSGFVYREENELVQVPITYRLRNAFTRSGNETYPSPFEDSQAASRIRHGVARITILIPICTAFHNHINYFIISKLSILFFVYLKYI